MRIIIIEDNHTLADGMGHVLRDEGHSVDILYDGQEGLDFLQTEDAADLIILDINLPSLNEAVVNLCLTQRRVGYAVHLPFCTWRHR